MDRRNVLFCNADCRVSFFQTRLGNQLNSLETRWTELISNVLQIEMANVALEAEIERLHIKEDDLAQ
jgi:pre-mRNA-splicing factor SPF27